MTLFIILKGCCEFYYGRIGKTHQIICTALLYKKFSSMILELLWVERLVASLFVYKAEKNVHKNIYQVIYLLIKVIYNNNRCYS